MANIVFKPFVQGHLNEVDWPEDYAYSSSAAAHRNEVELEKELGKQVWDIHNAAEECDKMSSSEKTWNGKVLSPLLDQVVVQPQYKGAVDHVDMYALVQIFKLVLTDTVTVQVPVSRPCPSDYSTRLALECRARWLTGAYTSKQIPA